MYHLKTKECKISTIGTWVTFTNHGPKQERSPDFPKIRPQTVYTAVNTLKRQFTAYDQRYPYNSVIYKMKCTDAIKFILVTVTSGISHRINQPSPYTVGTTAIHTALLMVLWKIMAHAH